MTQSPRAARAPENRCSATDPGLSTLTSLFGGQIGLSDNVHFVNYWEETDISGAVTEFDRTTCGGVPANGSIRPYFKLESSFIYMMTGIEKNGPSNRIRV
jgi:hypothetical protein